MYSSRFSDPLPLGSDSLPLIVQAAQSADVITAARRYSALGLSVLPLRGKQPALRTWKAFQERPAIPATLNRWESAGLFHNVGIACGAASGGLVVLDLDQRAAYLAFAARFPHLAATFTVTTGSGQGHHAYLFTETLPLPCRALDWPSGNVELRATGQQVVAPPSIHPRTGRFYTVARPLDVLRVPDLDDVVAWIAELQREPTPDAAQPIHPDSGTAVNPDLVEAIAAHFRRAGYRQNGPWLNGPCIYPERHAHNDLKPSFGFNAETGYGNCFVCGSILAKDIALRLGIPLGRLANLRTTEGDRLMNDDPKNSAFPLDDHSGDGGEESTSSSGTTLEDLFGPVIHAYTREQALEDGVLVDAMQGQLADVSRQHYKWPIAMTASVWGLVERAVNNPKYFNDLPGVWHDILWMSRVNGMDVSPTERQFIVIITGAGRRRNWPLKIISGPDDEGQPCLTVMLPHED